MNFFDGYLGLVVNATPGLAVEASGGGYARQTVTFLPSGDGRQTFAQSSSYSFGLASDDWGLVTGLALFSTTGSDELPLVSWAIPPRTVSAGQTLSVSAPVLRLRSDGYFPEGATVGMADTGADVVATRAVCLRSGVLLSATATNGAASLSLSELNGALSQLMQGLPQSDPGDGVSLWCNANLLALSTKSS